MPNEFIHVEVPVESAQLFNQVLLEKKFPKPLQKNIGHAILFRIYYEDPTSLFYLACDYQSRLSQQPVKATT